MCFEKVPCIAIYIVKIGIWNDSQRMWDSFQTSVFNAENLNFLCFWNLSCVCRNELHAHAAWLCAQADSCVCMLKISLVYFSKNRFICSLKFRFSILIFLKLI